MMRFIRPRLRKPLLRGIAGMGLAGAWAIGGGPSRWLAIVIAIGAVGHAVAWYVWAGHDDDGALLGSRADERQQLVGQKAGRWPGLSPWPPLTPAWRSRWRSGGLTPGRSRSCSPSPASLTSSACLPTVPVSPIRRMTPTPSTRRDPRPTADHAVTTQPRQHPRSAAPRPSVRSPGIWRLRGGRGQAVIRSVQARLL